MLRTIVALMLICVPLLAQAGKLPKAVPIEVNLPTPPSPLPSTASVVVDVQVTPLAEGAVELTKAMPLATPLEDSAWLTDVLPIVLPLNEIAVGLDGALPVYAPLAAFYFKPFEFDHFQGVKWIWLGGVLGTYKREAIAARKRGDEAEYQRLLKAYWETYGAALGRRQTLVRKERE